MPLRLTGAMTTKREENQFRKDVLEFTQDLRTNRLLAKLRAAFSSKGFPADELLLAGYLENEDGIAVGAIVSKHGVVHEFECDHEANKLNRFRKVKPSSIETYIDAIHVAVEFFDELFGQLQVRKKGAK